MRFNTFLLNKLSIFKYQLLAFVNKQLDSRFPNKPLLYKSFPFQCRQHPLKQYVKYSTFYLRGANKSLSPKCIKNIPEN